MATEARSLPGKTKTESQNCRAEGIVDIIELFFTKLKKKNTEQELKSQPRANL